MAGGFGPSGPSLETALRVAHVFRPARATRSVVRLTRSLRSRCCRRVEGQIFARQMQVVLKRGNDQRVVLASRQAGNGDCADASRSFQENRETAAVRRIVL